MAAAQAWIIVVASGLPEMGSGIVLGTSTSIPSTFTRIFSTGGCTGLGSAMTVVDILGARLNTNPFRAH
ncbi:MAG: hypothetical protein ACLQM8_10625 [Limisphaerales bacterium]